MSLKNQNKKKVTSYETSKRLSEVGFKSETFLGWWDKFVEPEYYTHPLYVNKESQNTYQAYDCHDLLMWLQSKGYTYGIEPSIGNDVFEAAIFYNNKESYIRDKQPQEALAKAVIKILEEIKGENS